MKENVISVKLNHFTKDKVRSLVNAAERFSTHDKNISEEYLQRAQLYIQHQFTTKQIFNGALDDLFGYGTGCPLLHSIKLKSNNEILKFFIDIGVNSSYSNDLDNEFLNFG